MCGKTKVTLATSGIISLINTGALLSFCHLILLNEHIICWMKRLKSPLIPIVINLEETEDNDQNNGDHHAPVTKSRHGWTVYLIRRNRLCWVKKSDRIWLLTWYMMVAIMMVIVIMIDDSDFDYLRWWQWSDCKLQHNYFDGYYISLVKNMGITENHDTAPKLVHTYFWFL